MATRNTKIDNAAIHSSRRTAFQVTSLSSALIISVIFGNARCHRHLRSRHATLQPGDNDDEGRITEQIAMASCWAEIASKAREMIATEVQQDEEGGRKMPMATDEKEEENGHRTALGLDVRQKANTRPVDRVAEVLH